MIGDEEFSSGEIDRCLKKVIEGVETFDDIFQKVMKFRQVVWGFNENSSSFIRHRMPIKKINMNKN